MTDISDLRILLCLLSYDPNKKLLSHGPLPFSGLNWMGLLNVRNLSKLALFPLDKLILKQKYRVLDFNNLLQCHYVKSRFL